ncbi:MAG: hypothetical protein PWP56_1162 [Acetobacterium sp.]|nr:hypothetical protein [Acetobacterium sp.]
MNPSLKNKIQANDTNISALLKDQKFTIDYFQREYRWQKKHIELLIEDLSTTFLKSYDPSDAPHEVENYQSYYLGPLVFSINTDSGKKSIIDGQQRITSITLLLIYLNHLQKNNAENVSITSLIFSEKYRIKSFNMSDEIREPCLKSLFETGEYNLKDTDDETIQNMVERYDDIAELFPDELTKMALPFFIDWLIGNVVLVEITAYSDENAYTIFETMNDRGLNLTSAEMLKGYVLSKITDVKKRTEINEIWKVQMQKLHKNDENADQAFFQSWFRGKYATSIRPGQANSIDQDFELIGSRFHSWFKENDKAIFNLDSSDKFYDFFKFQLPFFVDVYLHILEAQDSFNQNMPHINYINYWGIAESLQNALLLSPICYGDDNSTIEKKLDFTARYIETFTVRRSINYRKFGQSSIKYTMFNIIKLIRNNDLKTLGINLSNEIGIIPENWNGIEEFGLHGQNRKFIKHLLSRMTSYVDTIIGKDSTYITYHHPNGKQFEIEHIWANKFDEHKDEFIQENDFQSWRNSIGALILLPQGTNQSFSDDKFEDKIQHYLKENTYAQTLNQDYYVKNPNFLKKQEIINLGFKPYTQFKKADIEDREKLVKRICENLWSIDYFIV